MPSRLSVSVLLAALVMLLGVAMPPVIEDHLEAGFCSADCPVQHAGYGAAIAPPPRPSAARRAAPTAPAAALTLDADLDPLASPDAPRAPPTA
jgi:hypothetical protein